MNPSLIPLDSSTWSTLTHCYGPADDIPVLLIAAAKSSDCSTGSPWFELWSALCHQGDTFDAAYAAMPHLVQIARTQSLPIAEHALLLATSIELSRHSGLGPELSVEFKGSLIDAVRDLGAVAVQHLTEKMSQSTMQTLLACIAVSFGHYEVGSVLLDSVVICPSCSEPFSLADILAKH